MENLGRYLIVGGLLLVLIGAGLYFAAKLGLPLGRLPGDIHIGNDSGGFYFPIATSIILSVILTVVLNILLRLLRK